ncbi:hypothetical protein [Hymenobacter volaticus]|uniref:Uncharacterized protein n=1 Tax=Hymenobacter volaticus TaxID=2932254 RepID=A0ABY4G213_9BACT|nr:hypothetical protein [Hymenobacter volaticus]UOQ64866.1 hypothetical protein MUN86_14985 [Hymenobacter volaticus]
MANLQEFFTPFGRGTYSYNIPPHIACAEKIDLIAQFKRHHPQQANKNRFLLGICSNPGPSGAPQVELALNEVDDNGTVVHKIAQMIIYFQPGAPCFDAACLEAQRQQA